MGACSRYLSAVASTMRVVASLPRSTISAGVLAETMVVVVAARGALVEALQHDDLGRNHVEQLTHRMAQRFMSQPHSGQTRCSAVSELTTTIRSRCAGKPARPGCLPLRLGLSGFLPVSSWSLSGRRAGVFTIFRNGSKSWRSSRSSVSSAGVCDAALRLCLGELGVDALHARDERDDRRDHFHELEGLGHLSSHARSSAKSGAYGEVIVERCDIPH